MRQVKIYDKEYPYETDGELFHQIGATTLKDHRPDSDFEWIEFYTYVALAAGALSSGQDFKIKLEDIGDIFNDHMEVAEFFIRLIIDTDLRKRMN